MLRKYQLLHDDLVEWQVKSALDKSIGQDERDYVLMGLHEEACKPTPRAPYEPVPIRGWAPLPDLEGDAAVTYWT